jgi:hypothetical protein
VPHGASNCVKTDEARVTAAAIKGLVICGAVLCAALDASAQSASTDQMTTAFNGMKRAPYQSSVRKKRLRRRWPTRSSAPSIGAVDPCL